MPNPLFSLVYTSVRAATIPKMLNCWLERASGSHPLEIVLTVDANDQTSQEAARQFEAYVRDNQLSFDFKWFIQPEEPFCCVKGWNLAAQHSTGKIIVQVTDDFVPPPQWDTALLALEPHGWPDGDYAVHVNDGYVRTLMTLVITTRKRYERYGYLFYPDYLSLFSDTEFTDVAYRDGVVIKAPHLLFEHMHPDCHKRNRDEVDLVHASSERWQMGETLYNFRKQRNFPVDVGPRAGLEVTPAVKPREYACYIQATRNDFCLQEVCQRMFDEGVRNFFFSVPDEYWSGRPNPPEDIQQVKDIADWCQSLGAQAKVIIHKVSTYRFTGDTRIRVETRVRNDALSAIRKAGFQHVLIVDGDELWKRGTLRYVDEIVTQAAPAAISTFMIPAIGLPGYPIDGATDVAVVYINSDTSFRECRTPIGEQHRLHMPLVIHFTGCRRTMEEIIRKHRDSGHYDDPDYDFEGWIKNVLPNIRPGLENAHMYTKYQIWPRIRHWRAEELREIPETLYPFLTPPTEIKAPTTA